MSQVFPDKFDLKNLPGSRAAQYSKPEDGFQQLVGDGLRCSFGHHAAVYPTKGQDGSIDAFIDIGCLPKEPFTGIELPAIFECKCHDDSLPRLEENIFSGWKDVAAKLKRQAQRNWPDRFSPWKRAVSYIYCISATFPDQHTRDRLQRRIENFFAELPEKQRPPIAIVRVMGWAEIRHWLSTLPQVCDGWLGVQIPAIVEHEKFVGQLQGFRKFLLTSSLQFISPESTASSHPHQIFRQLSSDGDTPGVLLVAPGGAGKTRTSLEVANIAAGHGWRVLHVLPGEPAATAEDIANTVLPHSVRTLLVFDYLDQMQHLDLGVLRTRLLPDAKARGTTISLLANSRPGWMRSQNSERDELFVPVPIRLTPVQSEGIVEEIITRTAPLACELIGKGEVTRLCGRRPIIALLVTQELERRATSGNLSKLKLQNFRTGDLARWLQERLSEPPLNLVRKDALLDRPEIPMVALAASLACAPARVETLVQVAEQTFRALDWDRPEEAGRLIERLLELGWLENDGPWIVPAHDVVSDEVFDWAIRDGSSVRVHELNGILASTLHVPQALGRFATAFRRLFSGIDDAQVEAVQNAATKWLHANLPSVSASLVQGDPNVSGYALGSVMFGPPWDDAAIDLWDQLIAPWLAAHGEKDEARHVLTTGLSHSRTRSKPEFLDAALRWIKKRPGSRLASFVLVPLLERNDLQSLNEPLVEAAVDWLQDRRLHFEAEYVLYRLLLRQDLGSVAERVYQIAIPWLNINNSYSESARIIGAALHRGDLGNREEVFFKIGSGWLSQHTDHRAAAYILEPLLQHAKFKRHANFVAQMTSAWLETYALKEEAAFVFKPFLNRRDLPSLSQGTIAVVARWLRAFNTSLPAGFVLPHALARHDLNEHAIAIVNDAFIWLELHWATDDARFVLPALLDRDDVGTRREQIVNYVSKWLTVHGTEPEAAFVLEPVLLGSAARQFIERAESWLQIHWRSHVASFVLKPLLERQDLGDNASRIIGHASNWIDVHHASHGADFVLNRLLRRKEIPRETWTALARILLHAAAQNRDDQIGLPYTLTTLCVRAELLDEPDRMTVANLALDWLESSGPAGAVRVRSSFEKLAELLPDEHPLKLKTALLWGSRPRFESRAERFENREERFEVFVTRLQAALRANAGCEPLIEEACRRVRRQAERAPASAAYALPALLILGARSGGAMLHKSRDVARAILGDKRFTEAQRRGLIAACLKSANREHVSSRGRVINLLGTLGLNSQARSRMGN